MVAQRRQPTLIVVHTKDLAFQWTQRIEAFLGIAAAKVGMIGGGKKVYAIKVTNENEFYDIDEKLDILGFNIEKR